MTDGLNVEDNFYTNPSTVTESVKSSLLTGDALFIVRLNSKLPGEESQSLNESVSPPDDCKMSTSEVHQDLIYPSSSVSCPSVEG